MSGTGAYKVAVAVAVVLVVAAIAYGYDGLRADEANGPPAVATSTPVATTTVVTVATTTEPRDGISVHDLFGTTTSPIILAAKGVDVEAILASNTERLLVGGFTIQVRGGDNPCRYLMRSNRVGTFAGGEMVLEFVAGTHDEALAATGEMHLYGDTGPHLFEIEDAGGNVILRVPVGRGETVRESVIFPRVGLYKLYDRLFDQPLHVSEINARPIGQPGSVAVTDFGQPGSVAVTNWCPAEDSAP
jgi:hypothetical protein